MQRVALLPELARHMLRHLEATELLRLSTVSRSIQAIVCSILKARLLGLLDNPKQKAVLFEATSPSSPSVQLSQRLLFRSFVEDHPSTSQFSSATSSQDCLTEHRPSTMIASFGFCNDDASAAAETSRSMLIEMDPHQSFETLLLSVRLQPLTKNGERDIRHEVDLAEGLERIWRTWCELPATADQSGSASDPHEQHHTRGRRIERRLSTAQPTGLSQRTVAIDKTIARANVLLYPFDSDSSSTGKRKSAESVSRERRAPLRPHATPEEANGLKKCTLAWSTLDLNVARVVVEHELAQKKRTGQIVLFWQGGSSDVNRET